MVDHADQLRSLYATHPVCVEAANELDRLRAEKARLVEDRARFPDRPDDIGRMIHAHYENLKHGKESANEHARAAMVRCSVAVNDCRELIAATEFLTFYKDDPERPADKMTGARVTFGELRRVVVARARLVSAGERP